MHIFIVGPMASGKSTIGKILAKILRIDFIDTDKEIERKAGVDISWIFEIEGEKGFRERERNILKEITKKKDLVISTGGGIVLLEENRKLMSTKGKVIYLKTPLQIQLNRTINDKIRPLLGKGNKREILKALKKERDPLYHEIADVTINQKEKKSSQILSEIIDKLNIK